MNSISICEARSLSRLLMTMSRFGLIESWSMVRSGGDKEYIITMNGIDLYEVNMRFDYEPY